MSQVQEGDEEEVQLPPREGSSRSEQGDRSVPSLFQVGVSTRQQYIHVI